jgi:hypothetical protein
MRCASCEMRQRDWVVDVLDRTTIRRRSIAVEFETSEGVVAQIVRGESWAHVGGPVQPRRSRARLTEKDVAEMRCLVEQGQPQAVVAARFGVSQGYVSQILSGKRRSML